MVNSWEIHKHYNKYSTLPWKRSKVCLWKWVSYKLMGNDQRWVTCPWSGEDGWLLTQEGNYSSGRRLRCVLGDFCLFLHGSLQLESVFCIHLVLLMNKIVHKQTQNSHYAQIVPWCIGLCWNKLKFQDKCYSRSGCIWLFLFLKFVKKVNCIHYFLNFKLVYHSLDKSYLIMMHYYLCMLLDLIC